MIFYDMINYKRVKMPQLISNQISTVIFDNLVHRLAKKFSSSYHKPPSQVQDVDAVLCDEAAVLG